ncbi:MAG: ankyrin repeat domain-containing protein [Ottowia sp.]|nr:ankyrin repeat domain-containing protein [Ottowia sp.]
MSHFRTHTPAPPRTETKVAILAAAALLACSVTACALDQPFAGLGNVLGSPAQAKTATSSQNSILAAVQSKVAAGADAKTLRQELSNVIKGGCCSGEEWEAWKAPDMECLSRAYAPAAVESRLEAARFLLDNGVSVNQKNDDKEEPLDEALGLLIWEALPNGYSVEGEGLSKMAALLVSEGANANGKAGAYMVPMGTGFTGTPLGVAAMAGSVELVRLLLEKGAKVNDPSEISAEDVSGRYAVTPLKLAQDGLEKAGSGVEKNKYQEIIGMLKAAGGKLTPSAAKKGKGKKR